jgi:hypothetical protein
MYLIAPIFNYKVPCPNQYPGCGWNRRNRRHGSSCDQPIRAFIPQYDWSLTAPVDLCYFERFGVGWLSRADQKNHRKTRPQESASLQLALPASRFPKSGEEYGS